MNDFFKFDDKRIIFSLFLIIDIILLSLTIYCISCEEFKILIVLIIILTLLIFFTIFIYNEGIHFDYEKEKIILVNNLMIKSIDMKNVKYFNLECKTTKKGKLIHRVFDTYDQVNFSTDHVYNNGQVYNFVFYLKDQTTITIYYGWLYRTRSIERIEKQLHNYKLIRERFMKYKNY